MPQGATFQLYSPLAKADEVAAITPSAFSNDPYEAAKGVDAILVLTPSKGLKDLDFAKLRAATNGALLFDTCNILCDKRRSNTIGGIQLYKHRTIAEHTKIIV